MVVDDVGADGVEEARVVRDDHRRDARLRLEVCAQRRDAVSEPLEVYAVPRRGKGRTVLEPVDRLHVQVVGRLVEEKEVDLHEHGASEGDTARDERQ